MADRQKPYQWRKFRGKEAYLQTRGADGKVRRIWLKDVVMEQHLGRPLHEWERVKFLPGADKWDVRLECLVLVDVKDVRKREVQRVLKGGDSEQCGPDVAYSREYAEEWDKAPDPPPTPDTTEPELEARIIICELREHGAPKALIRRCQGFLAEMVGERDNTEKLGILSMLQVAATTYRGGLYGSPGTKRRAAC